MCLCERMRNIRHRARVQLGKHSGRLLAHRHKAVAELAESTPGERLELAPEGANMKAVEIIAVSLLQRKQLLQIPCMAQVASELHRIELTRPQAAGTDDATL